MTTITPQSWARALLTRMHFPVTENNLISVLAWEYAEGGHFHNGAHWNPLNTTRDGARYGTLPGNSAGVAVYPNYETGLTETVATLNLPYYAAIRRHLAASANPAVTTAAIAASPWGTWHGSSPTPVVERARREVHAHPAWVQHRTGSGGKGHPGPTAADGGGTVVLDLAELGRLSNVYANASDRVLAVRARLQSLAEELRPALHALPDKHLAGQIGNHLEALTGLHTGFDSNARQMHDIAQFTGTIRRLAEEADANHNGRYSTHERVRFLETHPYTKGDREWVAVVEALEGGTIRRSMPGPAHSEMGPAKRVDAVVSLALRQHAAEHDGDNVVKYNEWFGDPGQPWCATFVSWVFYHSGHPLPHIQGPKGFAYVPYAIRYAETHHQLSGTPHVGNIFLLKDGSHCGIVTKVYPNGTFDTVEGNYGNQVAHVHRNSHDGTYDFWAAIR